MSELWISRVNANVSFFSDTESFTSHQENKLRLWQALCIEVSVSYECLLTTVRARGGRRPGRPAHTAHASLVSALSSLAVLLVLRL